MAFGSPSPGPEWTALPEPVDSSGPSSEVDEGEQLGEEQIDFTPPTTQQRQQRRSPAKKATSSLNNVASTSGPSKSTNSSTLAKRKPPQLLKRTSNPPGRPITSETGNASSANAGKVDTAVPSASQARPRPSSTIKSASKSISAVAGPSRIQSQKKVDDASEVICISSSDESSASKKKAPLTASSGPTPRDKGTSLAKTKERPKSPQRIQTARKSTGGVMPRKKNLFSKPAATESDSRSSPDFPTGLQLSQQVREEQASVSTSKGKGKAPMFGSGKPPKSGKARPTPQSDSNNRRHTISSGAVIDLCAELDEVAPSQNRRASLQGPGSKDIPFVVDDSGGESPPNTRPVSSAIKKKKKIPTLLPRTLDKALIPIEMARAISGSSTQKTPNIAQRKRSETINLLSSDEEERSSNRDRSNKPTQSSKPGDQDGTSRNPAPITAPEPTKNAAFNAPGDYDLPMDEDNLMDFDDPLSAPEPIIEVEQEPLPAPSTPTPATSSLPPTSPATSDIPSQSTETSIIKQTDAMPSMDIEPARQVEQPMVQIQSSTPTKPPSAQPVIRDFAPTSSYSLATNAATDDSRSSVDGDAAEVDALLESGSMVDSHRSTPMPDFIPEPTEERRPTAPTLASELDNLSLQKSAPDASTSSLPTATPSLRPATPDESAIPLLDLPKTPKSSISNELPSMRRDVTPLKFSQTKTGEGVRSSVAPAAPPPSLSTSVPAQPPEQRRKPPRPFDFFKDAIKDVTSDAQPPSSDNGGSRPFKTSNTTPSIPKTSTAVQTVNVKTSASSDTKSANNPISTPLKNLPVLGTDKTPASSLRSDSYTATPA
ncbi:hypothetical protein SCHPADRAFT_233643 [Schizopora paradoxa]|uniref:Uncharacterized protein n=1 Tax=Schizopora paradoxa TaxID=27342 RepID=A0A0H2SG77_9AGAM|nr:hypothetical protein SCHPADRAFT_233643 [Schizopora paradoxa]